MGLLTINLPDHVIKELKKCGAYVPDLVLRAITNSLEERKRSLQSSAQSKNWELDARSD